MRSRYVSVIFPCLNEEKTIGPCIASARRTLQTLRNRNYMGEIIVVDNGSTDASLRLARQARVRVISEKIRGYGAAIKRGIREANGSVLFFADADGTYDVTKIPAFMDKLEQGADLVIGSRFSGNIEDGAMPFTHRHIGNPLLTFIINISFHGHVSDSQTGMRAMKSSAYTELDLRASGMEFASEMIIKAMLQHKRIEEIPIRYKKRVGISKLKPMADLWRHLKLILLYSPSYLYILPGGLLLLFGLLLTVLLYPSGRTVGNLYVDIHTFTFGFFAIQLGLQILLLGMLSRVYTTRALNLPNGPLMRFFIRHVSVESLFVAGIALMMAAMVLFTTIYGAWSQSGFTHLAKTREIIASAALAGIGAQLLFSGIVYGLLKE